MRSSAPYTRKYAQRQHDAFRGWVTADGWSGYPAAKGRDHL